MKQRVDDARLAEMLHNSNDIPPSKMDGWYKSALDLRDARAELAASSAREAALAAEARTSFDAGHVYGFAFGVGYAGGPVAEAMKGTEAVCPSAGEADRAWEQWNCKARGAPATLAYTARVRAAALERMEQDLYAEVARWYREQRVTVRDLTNVEQEIRGVVSKVVIRALAAPEPAPASEETTE